MAKRQNTFLIKRSNVPGKVPNPGDLQLGELALNTADVILYASGTTSNQILPIGWDRLSILSGGTVNGNVNINGSISATTYLNLPSFSGGTTFTGGTVSGATVFQSGLTANTIYTDYIDFNTTPTVPSPTGGTLYFDSNENALSYKPITNQNDVTVNLGQESLIRIYNDLPTTILNGQVLHITGATSGVPTVALANASNLGVVFTDSLAQSSGVATHDIPSGEYGFMTNFGVVRDLNTTAFTVGQEVFLSDTIDGGLTNDPNNIAFTSRISTVGYCLESNATTGKILVVITNENPLQSLTQQEINVLLGNTISTGAYFYTGATTASTTTINVSPMRGWIVYNTGPTYATSPLVLNIYYSGGTNLPVSGLTSSFDTYLLVNSGGTLYQTNTYPTPQERRQNIFLGRVVHPNKTTILNVEQSVDYDVSPLSSLRDLWVPIKIINEGVVPSSNGATLTFKTSSGTFWGNGIGFPTDELNPNAITVPGYLPASFYYTTQTGGTFTATTTTVDTLNYDVNGVKTLVPGSGNYTTQRIYMSQSGVIRLQYGQNYYSTLAKAIAAIPSETFVVNPDNSIDCTLIGLLTVKDGTGDLSNTDDAVFTFVSKFGEILGGTAGISTTTLQQAYNNSVNPEIVTNSILGGVQFRGGTGIDSDSNIIIENNSGVVTGKWLSNGYLSATTLYSSGNVNVGGNIIVTGGTGINWFSSNTSTDLVRITQTGSGNALFIEDSTNPDSSPFVVDASGNVGIGTTSPTEKLYVSGNTYVLGEITTDSVVTMPNFKYIQNKNDFPTAIGGIITLSGDTTYFINTTVDLTGDRLVAGQNTTILGGSSENCRLKSTGLSGTALLSSAWSIPMRGLTIESDVALNLDAGGNANQAIDWFGVNFTNCNTIGLIKDYSNIIWTDCAILESADCTFSGTISTIGFSTCLFNGISGKTIFNIPSGCSITRRFRPIYSSFIVLPGETGITISNSAIVNKDGFILDTINFAGGGTYISGLDATSPKSLFSNNVGILNSSNVGHYYMINNTTNTTIGVPNVNVWVKAAGTTTLGVGNSPRWVVNGNNRLVYTGNTQQDFKFTAVGTVQSASVNQVISVGLAINGTIQTESEITVRTSTANQPYPFAIQDLAASLSAGTYIEVFVLNTQSPDIRVGDLNVIIDKISV